MKLFQMMLKFVTDKSGMEMGEYVVIGVLVLVAAVTGLAAVSGAIGDGLSNVAGAI
jgi:Flp pilus assembly pilin Flp